jgi:hypothetical protein
MKNLFLPLLLLLFCSGSLLAQDEANFSHYTVNPVLVNPAASGLRGFHQLQVNGRYQWSGISDSPKSLNALYNGPLGDKFGLGVGVLSENAGLLSRTKAMVNYSFFFDIKEYRQEVNVVLNEDPIKDEKIQSLEQDKKEALEGLIKEMAENICDKDEKKIREIIMPIFPNKFLH